MAGFIHTDFQRLLVWVGDEPAGAACAYVIDGVLAITGTSTLPPFRRRGVQQAGVAHALGLGPGAPAWRPRPWSRAASRSGISSASASR